MSGLPPPPIRRIRHSASAVSPARSFKPRPIVLAAMPVAADTAAIPPHPAAFASVAASKRRSRSFRCGERAEKRLRIGVKADHPETLRLDRPAENLDSLEVTETRFACFRTGPLSFCRNGNGRSPAPRAPLLPPLAEHRALIEVLSVDRV